jgi:hypothetical protein
MCDCIKLANEVLAKDGVALKLHPTVNLSTGVMWFDLALETYALRKGVKRKPLIRHVFCPFCGKNKAEA